MKEGKEFRVADDGSTNCDATFDWNVTGNDVLKAVDEALKSHGLEIVTHDTFGSFYAFSIKKIRKATPKKIKVHPLTKETLKQLGVALKQFGEYTFSDKGSHEVMDVDALAAKYRSLPAATAATVLWEVYTSKEQKGYGHQLAEDIISCLQDWEELFKQPQIDDIDW